MQFPRIEINRRHMRAQQLTAHLLHIIEPYLRPEHSTRDVARQIEELFWSQGVQVITEAMRIEAGLPIRDHNGMTLEELTILESRLIMAQLTVNQVQNELMKATDFPGEPAVKP